MQKFRWGYKGFLVYNLYILNNYDVDNNNILNIKEIIKTKEQKQNEEPDQIVSEVDVSIKTSWPI